MGSITRSMCQIGNCDGRKAWLQDPKIGNTKSICGRLDLPVEKIPNTSDSELSTFHWVTIISGKGGGAQWLAPFSSMQPDHQRSCSRSLLGRFLLTPRHVSLATTALAYLEARMYTRPYLLQLTLGPMNTDDSCSTPFLLKARQEATRSLFRGQFPRFPHHSHCLA